MLHAAVIGELLFKALDLKNALSLIIESVTEEHFSRQDLEDLFFLFFSNHFITGHPFLLNEICRGRFFLNHNYLKK